VIDWQELDFSWQLVKLHHLGPLPWADLVQRQIEHSVGVGAEYGAEPVERARREKVIRPTTSEWGQELYDVAGNGRKKLGLNPQYQRPVHVLTDGFLRQAANNYVVQKTKYSLPNHKDHRTGNGAARRYVTDYDADPACQVLALLDTTEAITTILERTLERDYREHALVFTVDSVAQIKLDRAFDGRVTAVPWGEVLPLLSPSMRQAFDGACDVRLGRRL